MRSLMLTAFLASALLPATACNLYFSGGDDDPPCDEWGGGWADAPDLQESELLRNPDTGICEDWSWGGGGPGPWPCDSECGPCATPAGDGEINPSTSSSPTPAGDEPSGSESSPGAARLPPPTWGHCESSCTGLDEQTCLATDRCRGIYDQGSVGPGQFRECWETDYDDYGVADCEGLDGYSCSTSDACVAVHEFSCDDGTTDSEDSNGLSIPECAAYFLSCHNEAPQGEGCYGDDECGEAYSCNASEICLSPPGGGESGKDAPGVCYGFCVPDICPYINIYVDCPEGYTKTCPPFGCEADCTCEPIDPGECNGDVFCLSLPPTCDAGSTPGIADGCWTGACIPLAECPETACDDIGAESMCIAREDCSAYYVGENCSCDASGCTCAESLFESCALDDTPYERNSMRPSWGASFPQAPVHPPRPALAVFGL
ncbi:MAG: hypothetical protein GY811_11885 [Myxococcales bacterium]|nr:hypothetical protein [Myxococcales bacterium]